MDFFKNFANYFKADTDIIVNRVNYCKNCPYI